MEPARPRHIGKACFGHARNAIRVPKLGCGPINFGLELRLQVVHNRAAIRSRVAALIMILL
jgi:hypothetical protein